MPETLDDWLAFIEHQHGQAIALGLDRVRAVKEALGQHQTCPVFLVGGTNGKGSICAMLERILQSAGYRVGLYTSPHLVEYNERVRIDGRPVADAALCRAFARVEAARAGVPLTYFEYGTLAAWEVFAAESLDAIILEVGLGGRLDATNAYEPDCAIIGTIDLDHMDYLGPTREDIGYEKAGICRAGRPAICGDPDPPTRFLEYQRAMGTDFYLIGRDFGYRREEAQWRYWLSKEDSACSRAGLAHPALRGGYQLANASCVLTALEAVRARLPVAMKDIRRGLAEVELAGRFQVVPGRPTVVLDVAHNPQAARALAENLGGMAFHPVTWAVFGMLRDKDIDGVIQAVAARIDHWLPASLTGPRAASAAELAERLRMSGADVAGRFDSPAAALAHARAVAGEDDRIVAFGSFLTVAETLRALGRVPMDGDNHGG